MRPSLVAGGRDNNLNLLRMLAALAVLVSHAWPITLGAGAPEPLEAVLGRTLGEVAVTVFFGVSGFLVAASWGRDPSPGRFAARRAKRLLPGLAVSLMVSALVMGPLVSAHGPGAHLADAGTWRFLWRNAALLPVEPRLPGVFEDNPYPAAAGSIWTLHYEALCYAGLLGAGVLGAFASRASAVRWLALYAAGYVVLSQLAAASESPGRLDHLRGLSLPFALGVAAHVWRDRLRLAHAPVVAFLGVGAAVAQVPAAEELLTLGIVAGAFWLGYVPGGPVRLYNRLGDYSYGLYLYAFPVQGLVRHLGGPMTPLENIALAAPATLALAVLSWRLVERPCLVAGALTFRRTRAA